MDKNLIEMQNVSKSFTLESGREFLAIENISLTLHEGEVLALLGPSGSGKSTCLRLMCGLHTPSTGKVLSRGNELHDVNYDVAMVFQAFALLPWESVYKNIKLALEPLNIPSEEQDQRIKKVIDLVGLEGFEEAYPRELSGGMKQRVGVARALVMERPILFLDEPFSALDVLTSETLRQEIMKIYLSKKTSIQSMLLVTHNIQEAVLMANRILVLGSNPGHIRQEFKNSLPYPRNPESPAFKDLVSRIHASITESYMPDAPEQPLTTPGKSRYEILPPVSITEVIGLVELLHSLGGEQDLFELAEQLNTDFGHILFLVKAAELLELVDTPKQNVVLTKTGTHFVEGDINTRKQMMHESLSHLSIAQLTSSLLKENGIVRMPISDLVIQLQSRMHGGANIEKIVETLIGWGRYAEYFGYNDDTKTIYLDVGQEAQ
ncbi:MAG: nitrate/sulfonate/bicarbonate ABC transporter ATP-binding protein [Bacillota bacterium]